MDKNQKKENSKKKNGLGRICLRIFFFIIAMIGLASRFDLDLREWLWYNLYYRPLYFFFSDFLYATFFYRFINIILITCFFLFLFIWELFPLEKEKERLKKKHNTLMQYFDLIAVIVIFALSAYFLYPFVLDMRYIVKKEYLIETSDITRYKRYTYHASKGQRYIYRLYTYTLVKKNVSYYFKEEERTGLSSYEFFELNEYQYKELKNYQSNLSMKDTVTNKKIKVYYLPNSRVILKYDFIN